MAHEEWDKETVRRVLANPYNCLSVTPDGGVHQPTISEAEWIEANVRLIREIGADKWLKLLLENLRGNYTKAD
jgi:hypothetical protein